MEKYNNSGSKSEMQLLFQEKEESSSNKLPYCKIQSTIHNTKNDIKNLKLTNTDLEVLEKEVSFFPEHLLNPSVGKSTTNTPTNIRTNIHKIVRQSVPQSPSQPNIIRPMIVNQNNKRKGMTMTFV